MYGARTLPEALDNHARDNPGRLYASIPAGTDIAGGFQDISCKDMARCVNNMATLVIDKFGQGIGLETLAYIGIPDLRGAIVFLGAAKAGYKVSRYTVSDQQVFMNKRSCYPRLVIRMQLICLSWHKPRAANYFMLLKSILLLNQ